MKPYGIFSVYKVRRRKKGRAIIVEDLQIIELYFARDERAIEETSNRYGRYCFAVANNILSDEPESEECVNDTYMRTWNAIPPTRPAIFRSFLAKITRNLALDRVEKRNAEKRGGRVAESLDELSECVGGPDGFEALEVKELAKIINEELKAESELSRNIFIRRYFYLDSIAEISKKYFIKESKVKTLLYRTRQRLAKRLLKEGVSV